VKVPHLGEYVEGELGRVLRALSVADRDGDHAGFHALCRRHAVELDADRDAWLSVPRELRESFRGNMEAMRPFMLTAQRIARELDGLGHPAALRRLSGADQPGNPMEKLHEAEILAEDGEFEAADALLREQLGEELGDVGWVASLHARLATQAVMRDDLDTAIEHARRAHELTRRKGSRDAARAAEVLDDLLTAREIRRGTFDGRRLGACREALTRAQQLSDRALFVESNRALLRLLDELDTYPEESSAHRFLGKLCGLMGLNHFHLGDRDEARAWTRKALRQCRLHGDRVGEEVYEANLKEIDRAG
jgi:tetratricopeptide (TPR) repeat protein